MNREELKKKQEVELYRLKKERNKRSKKIQGGKNNETFVDKQRYLSILKKLAYVPTFVQSLIGLCG